MVRRTDAPDGTVAHAEVRCDDVVLMVASYDAIGHVPRGVMRQLEDRMQAVEQKVRGAADSSRARTAPENPMVASMRAAVTKAEEQLTKAEAAGDARRIAEAKANLATRRDWLAEAEKSARR